MYVEFNLERKDYCKKQDANDAKDAEDGDFEPWGQFIDIEY